MTWRQKYTDAVAQVKDLQVQVDSAAAVLAAKDKQIAKLEALHAEHHPEQQVSVGVKL